MLLRGYLLALTLGSGILLPAVFADDEVVFKSDVSLVRVDAQVVDGGNRAITGLRATDFVLREEGRVQPIRNFASENMPVDVLLLLDVSASMRPHVQRIADAAHEALRVLRDDDRMGIMVFDRYTRLRMPFRNSRSEVEREMNRLLDQETFRGGTDITRGMYDAISYMARSGRRDARRAIVILTDDETQLNRDEEGVSRALTRADTVMCALIAPDAMGGGGMGRYPQGGGSWPGSGGGQGPLGGIILGGPRRGGYPRGGGPGMGGPRTHSAGTAEIARRSGGDSMSVDDASALETTLSRLRQRYALYFNLPPGVRSGDERTIEVSLADSAIRRHPDYDIRYRRTYVAQASAAPADPNVITRAPVSPREEVSQDAPPVIRRRPAVSDSPGPRQGPLDLPDTSATTAPQAQQPAAKPRPIAPVDTAPAPAPADDGPSQGGWRKARPDEK
jgi:VWFA-related protein